MTMRTVLTAAAGSVGGPEMTTRRSSREHVDASARLVLDRYSVRFLAADDAAGSLPAQGRGFLDREGEGRGAGG